MTDPGVTGSTRVAVYIDFDNIVISRYDQVNGRGKWQQDVARDATEGEVLAKLQAATVDFGAVIDYASSYGTIALVRAYANWASPANASYQKQLVGRSVDLVQLFPAAAYGKNGADIRLAIDSVEDVFRLPDVTHVVIVAGDSDYVPLAQRLKRLNRYVVGVGVTQATAQSLTAACDRFAYYDNLLDTDQTTVEVQVAAAKQVATKQAVTKEAATKEAVTKEAVTKGAVTKGAVTREAVTTEAAARQPAAKAAATKQPATSKSMNKNATTKAVAKKATTQAQVEADESQRKGTRLLRRALRLGDDASGWMHSSALKNQMLRLEPTFTEKSLGYSSFSDFVKSRGHVVELDESQQAHRVRLRT